MLLDMVLHQPDSDNTRLLRVHICPWAFSEYMRLCLNDAAPKEALGCLCILCIHCNLYGVRVRPGSQTSLTYDNTVFCGMQRQPIPQTSFTSE